MEIKSEVNLWRQMGDAQRRVWNFYIHNDFERSTPHLLSNYKRRCYFSFFRLARWSG